MRFTLLTAQCDAREMNFRDIDTDSLHTGDLGSELLVFLALIKQLIERVLVLLHFALLHFYQSLVLYLPGRPLDFSFSHFLAVSFVWLERLLDETIVLEIIKL